MSHVDVARHGYFSFSTTNKFQAEDETLAGPKTLREWELKDLHPSYNTKAMTSLRLTFTEIDELFLRGFRRSLTLLDLISEDYRGDWKRNLIISPTDAEDFERHIQFGRLSSEVSNIDYFQDQAEIRFWCLATEFLVLENEGFPGGQVFDPNTNGWRACPVPDVHASGFSSRILEIEKVASHVPQQVIAAMSSISHLSAPWNVIRHLRKRTDLLDSLFERTHRPVSADQHLISLAAQIDQSWPKNVPKNETFRPSGIVVKAYPKGKGLSIPTPTIMMITTISSVISISLAVVSYLKATPQPGTPQDADFFSLFQSSVLQISSIWPMMLTLRKTRLNKLASIYIWVLVVFGLLTAAVAVPLYILVHTGWSTLFSAASGVSQGFVTLQLVYVVAA
ncbi:uncharacterized protein LY89DRAFT_735501 [Mollisia scopiformis]|uniref:Uncharacterized protein n=1 Tax=Mollisia scopiformis TaxID=149040 RepID=A0A194X5D4_MOLSC|nr:uncharacterized protein LY89DRAFT_735501 [Mollisia scopiformis]KUJ15385.1 hypothetical protein LY89DRAFT_735501 [Mollisia scopiformis]